MKTFILHPTIDISSMINSLRMAKILAGRGPMYHQPYHLRQSQFPLEVPENFSELAQILFL